MENRIFTTNAEIDEARFLWERGVYLAEINEGFYTRRLYQLPQAYVEVVWHRHFNVVQKAVAFSDMAALDPYLEKISLEGLC